MRTNVVPFEYSADSPKIRRIIYCKFSETPKTLLALKYSVVLDSERGALTDRMVSEEKLVDGDLAFILQVLCQTEYGEHNIVIYPDLGSFREVYTRIAKTRMEDHNDLVMLLPHYETEKSMRQSLAELDINPDDAIKCGALEILDSQHAFFDPQQPFLSAIQGSLARALLAARAGMIVVADMGSFYHRQLVEELAEHECGIPSRIPDFKCTIFCCYHGKDFDKLTKQQEARLSENHYRNLFITTEK